MNMVQVVALLQAFVAVVRIAVVLPVVAIQAVVTVEGNKVNILWIQYKAN